MKEINMINSVETVSIDIIDDKGLFDGPAIYESKEIIMVEWRFEYKTE